MSVSRDVAPSLDDLDVPLLRCLQKARQEDQIAFHMPGHMGGQAWPDELQTNLAILDNTEIKAADNLLAPSPKGPVLQAEAKAAAWWRSGGALFLAQGSTHGLQIMLLYYVGKGGRLLISGLVHKAVYHAAALLDIELVFLQAEPTDEELEMESYLRHPMPRPTDPEELRRYLMEDHNFQAFLITSPDYFGSNCDLPGFAEVLREFSIPFLVDQAHGSHLEAVYRAEGKEPEFCATAMIMSTHKTIPAMTGGAILLTKDPADVSMLRQAADFYGSSSPSLMIAATSDYARAYSEKYGPDQVVKLLKALDRFEQGLDKKYKVWPRKLPAEKMERDPLRLVVDVSAVGPGGRVSAALRERGIYVEMSDLCRLVCIVALATPPETLFILQDALNEIAQSDWYGPVPAGADPMWIDLDKQLSARMASLSGVRHISPPTRNTEESYQYLSIDESMTKRLPLAADLVPYPPGVPLFLLGQVLTPADVEFVEGLLQFGVNINGIEQEDGEILVPCFLAR